MGGWSTSTRKQRLPRGWQKIRARALRRDGYRCCQLLPDGTRCTWTDPSGHTLEADHIAPGDNHNLANLQTLCGRGSRDNHHQAKTLAERRQPRQRPTPKHPGLL